MIIQHTANILVSKDVQKYILIYRIVYFTETTQKENVYIQNYVIHDSHDEHEIQEIN